MTSPDLPGPSDRNDLDEIARIAGDNLPPEVREAGRDPKNRFAKYILFKELGRGGVGYVRKAWDTMLGEYIALKFLREGKKDASAETRAREEEAIRNLLQEARLAARLRHANIVSVYDVGSVGKQFYIAMEYIQGWNLLDVIAAARKQGWPSPLYADPLRYLTVFNDVVEAIEYGHTFRTPIIHCDLKPSNILISKEGTAHVTDFGLARKVDPSKEEDIGIRGTPAYMAPEQLTGRSSDLGVWTDIYGLGGILYVLLTGKPPLEGKTEEMMEKIGNAVPVRPTQVILGDAATASRLRNNPMLRYLSRLEEICLRCLAKQPEDRYRTASSIASEIRLVLTGLAGESEEAKKKPESAPERFFKGLEPDLISKTLADHARQDQLIDALRGRLAERLNQNHPLVPEYPREDGSVREIRALKVSGPRIYVVHRGEVEATEWRRLSPEQIVALAGAAEMGGADDRLALGILLIRSQQNGDGSNGLEEPALAEEAAPAAPAEEPVNVEEPASYTKPEPLELDFDSPAPSEPEPPPKPDSDPSEKPSWRDNNPIDLD